MEDFLYPYNKPVVNGKYDLILDGKFVANEIVFKNLSSQNKNENVNLIDKIKDIESKLQNRFTFETVTELPTEGKESVIYLVPNGDTSGNENSYYEYLWDKTNSKFELIGSGSYEHLKSEIDKRVVINNPITITEGGNTTSITSDTISTTTLTGTLDAESMKNSLTAEAVQAVAPIAWFDSGTAFGVSSYASTNATALGYGAEAYTNAIAIGYNAKTLNGTYHEIVIGQEATAKNHCSITIGSNFGENVNGSISWHKTRTEGTGSITIGAGANTKNPLNPDNKTPYKNSDGEEVESSYSITIGQKAENNSPQNVVIGANAKATNSTQTIDGVEQTVLTSNSVTIGYDAKNAGSDGVVIGAQAATDGSGSIVIGGAAKSIDTGSHVAIGRNATCSSLYSSVAIGYDSVATGGYSFAIGTKAKAYNGNAICIGFRSEAHNHSVMIGRDGYAKQESVAINGMADKQSVAIGAGSRALVGKNIALGYKTTVSDYGATVIRSTAEDDTYTQLYFSGQNTPLAKTYYPITEIQKQIVTELVDEEQEDGTIIQVEKEVEKDVEVLIGGHALMGYTVCDKSGKLLKSGTRKLSDIFTDNSYDVSVNGENYDKTTQFIPSDVKLPTTPTTLELDDEYYMNDEEEYKPLPLDPIYPIVEPTIDEITN